MQRTPLFLILFAGLFGASGVAGAAIAMHGAAGGDLLGIGAAIALFHAPVLLALAAMPGSVMRLQGLAGVALIVGTMLFSGDLSARGILGHRLFANAAPAGGMILIAGWLIVVAGGIAAAVRTKVPPRPSGHREQLD